MRTPPARSVGIIIDAGECQELGIGNDRNNGRTELLGHLNLQVGQELGKSEMGDYDRIGPAFLKPRAERSGFFSSEITGHMLVGRPSLPLDIIRRRVGVIHSLIDGLRDAKSNPSVATAPQVADDFRHRGVVMGRHQVMSGLFHLVASHHYAAVTEIIRNLRSRGYRRIGFCISEAVDQRMDHTYSAAYYVQRETWPANEHVPRYLGREEAAPFGAWLKKCRPDSVIIPHFGFPKLLADLKIKMPEQLGAAIVSVVPDPELLAFSGVDDDSHEIGQVASSFLTAAIERGERGIPAHPQRILVAGFWREGSTLRALS